ncbi:MAG: hypothetical protein RL676_1105 [Pseudomonadota bacterium]|jgi:methionyl-tRNA formyltransferase
MRLVFAGTPEFARISLIALHDAGHEICAVFTQPDRGAGRGRVVVQSPVKQAALERDLPVMQPSSLRQGHDAEEARQQLRTLSPDVMVVAAYGLILPADVLAIPRWGCINIHASLLPRWRGAAPIQRAIAAGDDQTGVDFMQMEAGLDTGPVWSELTTPITPDDNFASLHDRLAELGAKGIVALLDHFPPPGVEPRPQPEEGIEYAHKITRQDLPIDWSCPARHVSCQIRAFDPAPGAVSGLQGEMIKIFDARAVDFANLDALLKNALPGQIVRADREGLWVACGEGAVALGALQRPNGKRLGFREFLNGRAVTAGQFFESLKE